MASPAAARREQRRVHEQRSPGFFLGNCWILATYSFCLTTGWHGTAALLSSLPSLNDEPGVSGTISFAIICLAVTLSSAFGAASLQTFGLKPCLVVNNISNGLLIAASLMWPTGLLTQGSRGSHRTPWHPIEDPLNPL